MEFLRRLYQQLRQVWDGMTPPRRLLLTLVLMGAVVALFWIYYSAQPEYRVLYTGLSAEDASGVINSLKEKNVPYRLASGGTVVQVPAEQLLQLRLDLAGEGLPIKIDKGYPLIDESTAIGSTPFRDHLTYQRALQAELARTIMRLEPVASARIHIVQPDPSPFVRTRSPATASVQLTLKPGASLNRTQAGSIVALVSHSVEGLAAERVALVDQLGRLLSEPSTPGAGAAQWQLEYRKALEDYLTTKAETLLVQHLGLGRAIVRVSADLDYTKIKETEKKFNPDIKVVSEEQTESSKSTGVARTAGGITGTVANTPGRQTTNVGGTVGGSAPTSQNEERTTTKFENSYVVQEKEDFLNKVKRMTVAVMVDLSPSNGTPTITTEKVADLVKDAVGFDANRKDSIQVFNGKLAVAELPPPPKAVAFWEQIVIVVRNLSLSLAALVGVLLMWMVLKRLVTARPTVAAAAPIPPEQARVIGRISAEAQRDPETVARILTSWLEETEAAAR